MGEPSLRVFGGVVFQGEPKAGKSRRQGGAMGEYRPQQAELRYGGARSRPPEA